MRNWKRDFAVLAMLIAIVTALHYLTIAQERAIHDFYRRLYYIPIILGAFKFRLRGGVVVATIISLLYLPHVLFYWGIDDIGFVNQLLEIAMFLLIGTITGYLVEQLNRKNIVLLEQLDRITEIEILNENILNSMSHPLIAVDNKSEVKILNNAAAESYIELSMDSSFANCQNSALREVQKPLREVLSGRLKYFDEVIRVGDETEPVVNHIRIYPLRNNDHRSIGAVVLIEDITEMHQLEEEIRRSEKLSALGVMVSGVAHEIRNPLGIVKTIAQTIKSTEGLTMTDREGLDIIVDEVDRANSVIKEILDFSRVESGVMSMGSVLELVGDVIRITQKFTEDKHVTIETDIDPQISCIMDMNKMKQVFMNLIMNAVDAMPDGGKIRIKGSKEGGNIVIKVSDSGTGIPEDKLESIFNPFYTTKDTGTGLGLSITYKIIVEHGGSLKVRSKMREGTEFVIELPYDREAVYGF